MLVDFQRFVKALTENVQDVSLALLIGDVAVAHDASNCTQHVKMRDELLVRHTQIKTQTTASLLVEIESLLSPRLLKQLDDMLQLVCQHAFVGQAQTGIFIEESDTFVHVGDASCATQTDMHDFKNRVVHENPVMVDQSRECKRQALFRQKKIKRLADEDVNGNGESVG